MLLVEDVIKSELGSRSHEFTDWTELKRRVHCHGDYDGARLGSYSLTSLNKKITLISSYHLWDGRPVSASSIARRSLNIALAECNRKRFNWNRANFNLLDIPQALYCSPVSQPRNLIYGDIKSAYWSILRRLPTYLYFSPTAFTANADRLGDYLPADLGDFKLPRNCLIGAMRATNGLLVKQGKIVRVPTRNNLLSPSHWGFLTYFLHAIAQYAIHFGAVYYNTDGAIFTTTEDFLKWAQFIEGLGLQVAVKTSGQGICTGIGRYTFGSSFTRAGTGLPRSYSNIIFDNERIFELWMKIN